ncbi:MAG: serine/threonine-protein kinase, partial [Streptosporangiaceae bacterium]
DESLPWFATEYVQGLTLSQYVTERGPLSATMVAALGTMLAEGLANIHTAGLLHRDLKPGNVILGNDGPRIIDFGLAGLADAQSDITHTSGMLGTPVCMAPEQAKSPKDLTTAADVYALGAVLMFALTGRYPYERPTVHALLLAIADPATDPDLSGIPDEIKQPITDMLAHHPNARRTLADITTELNKVMNGAGISPRQAQAEFAQLTYLERDTDPPPAPRPAKTGRKRLPATLHVPSDLIRQVAEDLRIEYARGAAL